MYSSSLMDSIPRVGRKNHHLYPKRGPQYILLKQAGFSRSSTVYDRFLPADHPLCIGYVGLTSSYRRKEIIKIF